MLFLAAVLMSCAAGETIHIKAAAAAYEKGRVAQRQSHVDAAIQLFGEAIEIEPTFTGARQALIQADLSAGYRLQAAAAITQLLQIEPVEVRDRIVLGKILIEQHQPERALAQFSAVLNTDPDDPDALLGFASTARELGMHDRAADALSRGRKRFPLDARFKATPDVAPQQ
jgi:tetratricopeptide (TPR) repeat protein